MSLESKTPIKKGFKKYLYLDSFKSYLEDDKQYRAKTGVRISQIEHSLFKANRRRLILEVITYGFIVGAIISRFF